MNTTIREAHLSDVEGIAHVHVDSWRSTYDGLLSAATLAALSYEQRQTQWQRWLSAEPRHLTVYVAEDLDTQQIVGFVSAGRAYENHGKAYQGELYTLYLLDSYQRRGLGCQLFTQVTQHIARLGITSLQLWVLASNPARNFYESMGGTYVITRTVEEDGEPIEEALYGWDDITTIN